MKLRIVPIEDLSVLQALVLQQTSAIEGQVEVIDIGINTDWGPLILGLDQKGCLIVLLISATQEENLLSRLIGTYGRTSRNLPLLSRCYTERGLDGAKPPRMVIIAPEFSRAVIDGLTYLAFRVEPYRYRVIEIDSERSLLLEPLQSHPPIPNSENEPEHSQGLLKASRLTGAELRFFEEGREKGRTFHSAI